MQAIVANPTSSSSAATRGRRTRSAATSASCAASSRSGVTATNDVDALLALKPDCVVYNPMWLDVDELVRILEAGVNVVTHRGVHHRAQPGRRPRPHRRRVRAGRLDDVRHRHQPRLRRAARHRRGRHLRPRRQGHGQRGVRHDALRLARHRDARAASAGRSTTPSCRRWPRKGTAVFGEAVRLVADALGVELDEIVCEAEYAQTTEDVVLGSWTIPAGCVAGVAASWQGRVGGRTVVELNVRWRKGQTLEPDWKIDRTAMVIPIDGRPTVTMQVGFLPPPDFEAKTFADFMVLGIIMTAMPPINAIPAVVAAAPGIVTYTDLPLTAAARPRAAGLAPARRLRGYRRFTVARTVFRHDERSAVACGGDRVSQRAGQTGERRHVEHHRRQQAVVDEGEARSLSPDRPSRVFRRGRCGQSP